MDAALTKEGSTRQRSTRGPRTGRGSITASSRRRSITANGPKRIQDGIYGGGGEANVIAADASTITIADPDNGCRIVMQISKSGPEQLTMEGPGRRVRSRRPAARDGDLRSIPVPARRGDQLGAPGIVATALVPHRVPSRRRRPRIASSNISPGLSPAPLGYWSTCRRATPRPETRARCFCSCTAPAKVAQATLSGRASWSGSAQLISEDKWPDEPAFRCPRSAARQWGRHRRFAWSRRDRTSILKFALEHYNVDPTRIYMTGAQLRSDRTVELPGAARQRASRRGRAHRRQRRGRDRRGMAASWARCRSGRSTAATTPTCRSKAMSTQ